ncbi:MAG: carboxymuconolactone decarboxylase family protein, partial [Dehalococcoidia bacterium]
MHAHGEDLRQACGDDALAAQIMKDYREASLSERARCMLDYAILVTRDAHQVTDLTLDALRRSGLSDADILDITEITGFFAMYNRLADALQVDLEPE